MKEITLNILTPEKKFFSDKITKLITEDREGSLGILPGYIDTIKILEPNISKLTTAENKEFQVFISQGILKVEKDNIEILCESAEWPEEIDKNRAEEALKRAKKRLDEKHENIDIKRAELALKRALVRLKLKNI